MGLQSDKKIRKLDLLAFVFLFFFVFVILAGVASFFGRMTIVALSNIFRNREFLFSLEFSLITSLISLSMSFLFSIFIAYIFSRKDFFGKRALEGIISIPIYIPPLVVGLMFLVLFGGKVGIFLDQLGIRFVFTPLGVIFAQFIIITPYVEKNIEVAFLKIDERYEFIGNLMGLSDFEVFRKITIPLAKQGILRGLMVGFSRAIAEFGATLMLAGAIRFRTETLPIAVFLAISSGDMDLAIAIGSVMLLMSFLLYVLVGVKFGKDTYN